MIYIIYRLCRLLAKKQKASGAPPPARPGRLGRPRLFGQLTESGFFHYLGDRITDLFPESLQSAGRLVWTDLMGGHADAIDGGQGPVHHPDDLGHVDLSRRPGQKISSVRPLAASQVTGPLELEEDLFQKPLRNVL